MIRSDVSRWSSKETRKMAKHLAKEGEEAYEWLKAHGFKNAKGEDTVVETG